MRKMVLEADGTRGRKKRDKVIKRVRKKERGRESEGNMESA